jgi:hypothetical protein
MVADTGNHAAAFCAGVDRYVLADRVVMTDFK